MNYENSLLKFARFAAIAFLLPLAGKAEIDPQHVGPDIPDTLDLNKALAFAIEHNFEIAQARERIREQEGLIVEVKSLALPNASVDSYYTKNARELSSDRGGPGGGDPSTQNWQVALNVRQTLYAGGGVRAALDAQRYVRRAALYELESVVRDSLLLVRTNFYTVLLARDQIAVQEQNVKLLEEQLQTARNRFEAGASSNFEVLRAEVALANAQPGLIRARNGFRIAIDQLRQSMGYIAPATSEAQKVPTFEGTLSYTPGTYELVSSLRLALENRPELKRLEAIVGARDAAIKNARSDYLPNLAVIGGYQWRKSGLSERARESLDGWTVGLQSSWAIFDGRATAGRVAQARSRFQQAKLSTAQARLSIEVEVRQAVSRCQEAAELADAAQKVVAQADEALRLADARYAAGTATQLDVLTARVALTESRTNQLQANYSYLVAQAELRRATGQAEQVALPDEP
ncbi:MAG: TolC family protein [Opitutaceae bacterium]|nr:TolC family protein [Opitutaceae bacterium]